MDDFASLEQQIRACLGTGDTRGAAALAIRSYGRPILAYLMGLLRTEEDALEVFSQFSENLWKSIGRFRQESSFRTWAYRLAFCAAKDHDRVPHRRRERRLETTEISKVVEEIRSSTPLFLKAEARERFAKLRENLDVADRSLLLLRVEKGLPWKEVAEVMSRQEEPLDAATARKRYERLVTRLRKLAEDEGLLQR